MIDFGFCCYNWVVWAVLILTVAIFIEKKILSLIVSLTFDDSLSWVRAIAAIECISSTMRLTEFPRGEHPPLGEYDDVTLRSMPRVCVQ